MEDNTIKLMRYFLPIIISLCVAFGVAAKKNKPRPEYPHAEVKVSYDYYKMFLYMGGEQIGGRAIRNKLLSDWAKRDNETGSHLVRDNYAYKIQLYVYKDHKQNNVSVYDRSGLMEYGTYTDPLDDISWMIGDK